MIGSLFVLGFTLSLDNFRTSLAFGGLPMSRRRSVEVALMFGFWDGMAPLIGILLGRYTSAAIGSTAEYAGAIALGVYGLYLVIRAWLTPPPEEIDRPWALYGLLVPLSLDNVVAGTSTLTDSGTASFLTSSAGVGALAPSSVWYRCARVCTRLLTVFGV